MATADRYARQRLIPGIGDVGQARLASARVVVVGLGALGSVAAELLARAGVGSGDGGGLVLIDRDVVELSNLQRQVLYATGDVGKPKAQAAAERLAAVNPEARVTPLAIELSSVNIAEVLGVEAGTRTNLIVDATDNAQTRYLVNDASCEWGIPWVYGGAVGTQGRVAGFVPGGGGTPCLRCLWETPPAAGELPTCDTAGVLNTITTIVAAWQVQIALRLLAEPGWLPTKLITIDAWSMRTREVEIGSEERCGCCATATSGAVREFLHAPPAATVTLCGRDTVQVSPPGGKGGATRLDLNEFARRWEAAGLTGVRATAFLLRGELAGAGKVGGAGVSVSLFADGRLLLQGLADPATARGWYDRLVGS